MIPSSTSLTAFSYHLGNAHNLMTVTLPLNVDLTERGATVIVDFHLDRFLDDVDLIADQNSTHGRAGDEGAQALVAAIESAFTLRQVRYPASVPPSETTATEPATVIGTPYRFKSSRSFPIPEFPADYPLTEERVRLGEKLFHDPILSSDGVVSCSLCHQSERAFTDHGFHNNGLVSGDDRGLEEFTGLASDRHRFSTSSLRNVALTAPYMHDGRFDTLEEVLAHYTGGVHRSPTLDPNLAKHPAPGIPLSRADQDAIIAFLETLTDARYTRP